MGSIRRTDPPTPAARHLHDRLPHLVGLIYASSVLDKPVPLEVLGNRVAILMVWTFFWRSAGCAWNDNIDQDFDRKTARCRNRPIARGAISTASGHVYYLFLVLAALAPVRLYLAPECTWAALVSVALAMIYPFGKRFTDFAQVILGCTLGSTITLSAYSVGLPALSPPSRARRCACRPPSCCSSSSTTPSTRGADTADDLKSGVKGWRCATATTSRASSPR
ncbi:UbiA prenyltransferase [Apiospora phragmitis]|uniref:UbiA prenyltransferase n=1 Tax=Apiospora phragmitis TaxID=2905665 RepID=A0ABR1U9I8_9PEZI